jgi:hypothetical protein
MMRCARIVKAPAMKKAGTCPALAFVAAMAAIFNPNWTYSA